MLAYQDTQTPVLDHLASIPTELSVEFCIEDCLECMRACERCAQDGLKGLPLRAMIEYRALLRECADYAMWTAKALATKDMANAANWCWLCAQLCSVCVTECAGWDREAFQTCADACRRCAESCREIYLLVQ